MAKSKRQVAHKVTDLLKGVDISPEVRQRVCSYVHQQEQRAESSANNRLKHQRNEIRGLSQNLQATRQALETARAANSGDGLIKLYHAGAQLISKQATDIKNLEANIVRGEKDITKKTEEIKGLLATISRGKEVIAEQADEIQRLEANALYGKEDIIEWKDSFDKLIQAKDEKGAQLEKQIEDFRGIVQDLGARMALDNAAKDSIEQQLADAHNLIQTLQGLIDSRNKAFESQRANEAEISAENHDLQSRLRESEETCLEWEAAVSQQQEYIKQLEEEHERLKALAGAGDH